MKEKWIDVSSHQGVIDWRAVAASGVKGVVIRAGYGNSATQIDNQFLANIKGALAIGLKVAVYWFSYADSVKDAQKEFAICKQIIEPYRSQILFVASDYEYDSVKYYKRVHGFAPSNDLVNQMVNAFLGAAKADRWGTMLYTNNDYRKNLFTAATITAWPIWLADYSGEPDIACDIQQTGSTGKVDGIRGNVDMNISYKDYKPALNFKSDTTSDMTIKHGAYYQLMVTADKVPVVTTGTTDVVTVLPRYVIGNDHYFYLCAVGAVKSGTGIYINGNKAFVVNVA